MNISLSEAIAKKKQNDDIFQSLEGHTEDCLIIFKDYLSKNESVLKRISDNFSLNYELYVTAIYLSLYLHDIGKLTVEFQKNIKAGKPCGNISHPFFGFPFIYTTISKDSEIIETILKLCVLSHHSQLYNRIYDDARLQNRVTYLIGVIKSFIEKAERTFKRIGFSEIFNLKALPIFKLPDDFKIDSFQLNSDIKDELLILKHKQNELVLNNEPTIKALYSLALSILKFCDAKASENFDKAELETGKVQGALLKIEKIDIIASPGIFKVAKTKVFQYPPYSYQKDIEKEQNNSTLLISAPCGRGKTEAALFKAIDIIEKENRNKIIFALPTQITSNAMYARLKDIFGDDHVGIYHSLSRFVHYTEGKTVTEDDTDVVQDDDMTSVVREEKVFLKPVTVTTVDHLVYSLVHGYKQADYALGNILTSVVIFDEIHYYEHNTLRYIIEAMEILKKLKVPHIAMSGTLPDCIVNKLGKEYSLVEDKEGFSFKPFIVERRPYFIHQAIDEIVSFFNKDEKQIIIVNTINKAQDIYRRLIERIKEKGNVLLYHSMFAHYDRAYSKDSKEAQIFSWKNNENSPQRWIIVSTQAIEISVDISCTIMHTEMAPIDAIGQRGGRLNRGAKYHNNRSKMIIYDTENYKPYFIGRNDEINFVKRTEEMIEDVEITYQMVKNWCSKVYSDVTLPPQNLMRVFNECTLFGLSPKEVRYSEEDGNLVKFREIVYIRQDVIPEIYWQQAELRKIPELIMVKIPYWWIKKYPDYFYVENERYTICRIPYSNEIGFTLDNLSDEDKTCLIF